MSTSSNTALKMAQDMLQCTCLDELIPKIPPFAILAVPIAECHFEAMKAMSSSSSTSTPRHLEMARNLLQCTSLDELIPKIPPFPILAVPIAEFHFEVMFAISNHV